MTKSKKKKQIRRYSGALRVLGVLCMVLALALTQVPVPAVRAENDDFRMDGTKLVKYVGKDSGVTIPNTVTEIATEAFADNTTIQSVTLPESLTTIDKGAFSNCTALKSVKIPDSVKEIGNSAFGGCTGLTSLTIGNGLNSLGAGAFSGCTALQSATISKDNPNFLCEDGVIYGNNKTTVCQMLAGRNKESYEMPSTVTGISEYAFLGCEKLKKVSLSSNLQEITAYAFPNCKNLEQIEVPYSVKSIQMKAFENCAALAKIEIPESVSFVHETAFDGCSLLEGKIKTTPISEGEDVEASTDTADSTVESKEAASKKKQPTENTTEAGEKPDKKNQQAPTDTTGNTATTGNETTGGEETVSQNTEGQDNTISENKPQTPPKQIDGMETVEGPDVMGKTKIIGGQALVLIDSKQANVITDGVSSNAPVVKNENDTSEDGTTLVKESYYRNKDLKRYDFPEGIIQIDDFAFARSGLTAITIPEGVTKIGYAAFYHCDELAKVTIPSTVTKIDGEAFQKTPWMNQWMSEDTEDKYLVVGDGVLIAYKGTESQVVLPDTVKSIATDAFKNHTELTDIVLPDSLTTIEDNAFNGCENLKNFTGGANVTNIAEHAFDNCPIEVSSTVVESDANNYIGTVGQYQILEKKEKTNPILNGLKWGSCIGTMIGGAMLLTLKKKKTQIQ